MWKTIKKLIFKNFWARLGTIAAIVGALIAYKQLEQPSTTTNIHITYYSKEYAKELKIRQQEIENSSDKNTDLKRIEARDIEEKIKNSEDSYESVKEILSSITDFIEGVKLEKTVEISDESIEQIKKGDLRKAEETLDKIVKSNSSYSSEAANNNAQLAVEVVNYNKALKHYKKSFSFNNYNKDSVDKAIALADRVNAKSDKDFFIKRRYVYGTSSATYWDNKGIGEYTGALYKEKKYFCGIERYKSGSYYVGWFDNGTRDKYGIEYNSDNNTYLFKEYILGNKEVDVPAKIINLSTKKKFIGSKPKKIKYPRGVMRYRSGDIYLGMFTKKLNNRVGEGCYFDFKNKIIYVYTHHKNGDKYSSMVIK